MLPTRSPRLAVLAMALSAACAAHAGAPADTHSATDLDAIKVTAERTHTEAGALGDRALRDTPFAITAVGREQIEQRQVVSLGEVFLFDPSVTTQVSAYASGWSSPIRNRGIDLNYDSYRVNGLQVSSWGTEWPLEVMEQVDLLKGPGGFLYGFGAPGGIVNYITKKPAGLARAGHRQRRRGCRRPLRQRADVRLPLQRVPGKRRDLQRRPRRPQGRCAVAGRAPERCAHLDLRRRVSVA